MPFEFIWEPFSICCGNVDLNWLSKNHSLSYLYIEFLPHSVWKHNKHIFRDEGKGGFWKGQKTSWVEAYSMTLNTSYSPTVLLQRLLNPAFKQRSIATSLNQRESERARELYKLKGYKSNAGSYYSSQLLHLSPNSWLFCSELLGVLNLQQNRRQIPSLGAKQLNAFFFLFSFFFFKLELKSLGVVAQAFGTVEVITMSKVF